MSLVVIQILILNSHSNSHSKVLAWIIMEFAIYVLIECWILSNCIPILQSTMRDSDGPPTNAMGNDYEKLIMTDQLFIETL